MRCRLPFWILAACFAALTVGRDWDITLAVATATGVGIYWLALRPQLASRLECRPLAYLGAISYSLYLVHMPVGLSVRALMRPCRPEFAARAGYCRAGRDRGQHCCGPHHVSTGRSQNGELARRLKRPTPAIKSMPCGNEQALPAAQLAA